MEVSLFHILKAEICNREIKKITVNLRKRVL